MLNSVRDWLFGRPTPPAWGPARAWAEAEGWLFRPTRERDGFAIEMKIEGRAARLEWGPSQRRYLGAFELRLRADSGLDPQLYALVMPRSLLQALERDVFNQFTDSVKTRLDEETPEEMRWLAMSPKLSAQQLGGLSPAFDAVSNVATWVSGWLGGALADALLTVGEAELAGPSWPLALIVQRGRLVLRAALPAPDPELMARQLAVFSLALASAHRELPPT